MAEGVAFQPLAVYKPLFQNPPDHKVIAITGGRGSAKSTHLSLFLNDLTYEEGHVILFTRYTMTAAEKSIIPEFTAMMDKVNNREDFEVTANQITNKISKSIILFSGIKTSSGNQTANLKSIPGLTTFVIDEGEEFLDEESYNAIQLSIRSVLRPNRVIWVQNPSNVRHFFFKRYLAKDATYPCVKIHTTYLDNLQNLSADFIQEAEIMKATNYKKYCHVFLGEWLDNEEGLLWDMDIINATRVSELPSIVKVIIAVDPAITAKASSDETGIVVIGLSAEGHGYLIEDCSGTYTPNEWGSLAAKKYHEYSAAAIVGEVNQGGDMVESTIKGNDSSIYYVGVRATKGKFVRAEPIYAFYQAGKIHHVGYFPKLEYQLASWNPNSNFSPDRMDAAVWGFTYLLIDQANSATYGNAIVKDKRPPKRL